MISSLVRAIIVSGSIGDSDLNLVITAPSIIFLMEIRIIILSILNRQLTILKNLFSVVRVLYPRLNRNKKKEMVHIHLHDVK